MIAVLELTLASLRTQSRRLVAPGVAVVLGIAFVATSLALGQTMGASVRGLVAGYYTHVDTVVSTDEADGLDASVLDEVRGTEGVERATGELTAYARLAGGNASSYLVVSTAPTSDSQARVERGRLPRGTSEIALSRSVATARGLDVGDTIRLTPPDAQRPASARVVGVVDAGRDPRWAGGTPAVFGTHDAVTRWTGAGGYTEVVAQAAKGVSDTQLTDRVREAVGGPAGAEVRTGTEHADEVASRLTGGTDVFTALLMGFALVALFVSALVIGNTFAILMARRTRETALLRAVGGSRGQVVRGALLEALVTGVVFSAVGTALGIAACRGLVAAASLLPDSVPALTFSVAPTAVVVPFVTGVLVVLAAAVRPVVAASAVAPLEALRPVPAVAARSRRGLVRCGIGVALVVVGGALLVVGGAAGALPAGLAGGMLSFVGVLMAGSLLVPAVARVVGAVPARLLGAPGRLAAGNAVANPRRAAATTAALLVGVTLVTTTAVGARTAQASVSAALDEQYSVDAVVTAPDGAVPAGVRERVAQVDGVTSVASVPGSELVVVVDGQARRDQVAAGVDDDATAVVRDPAAFAGLRDGVVQVSEETARGLRLVDGDRVTLRGPDGQLTAAVQVRDSLGWPWTLTAADLRRVDAEAAPRALLLGLSEEDAQRTVEGLQAVTVDRGVEVGGSAIQREEMDSVLDVVLSVVLSLLAVSVLIALVGIANTLSLSVLERTRESALLRALGTTRGQLRAMLALEAVLLALVGIVLGTALGIGYGVAGAGSVVGQLTDLRVVVPWGLLGGVAAAAVAAALVASVLPARRAARVSPAEALATE
ncbi:FtsX-like permease family protein [Janibacter melonis]|uniref:FtsX-like permease family protein n=1 Tax=Janibacter melonis TaxID=262209 RepID=A0A5P8FIP0_9MICO|nr:FtsX family ABC transporter permease [Janibacter melonis]QFQ29063.2 FtsX-like permease family protein [Janibacter melonis]